MIFKAYLELIPKYLSVNGISPLLMGSVCLGPKVIQLSGAHCINNLSNRSKTDCNSTRSLLSFLDPFIKEKTSTFVKEYSNFFNNLSFNEAYSKGKGFGEVTTLLMFYWASTNVSTIFIKIYQKFGFQMRYNAS